MADWKIKIEMIPESANEASYHPVIEALLTDRGYHEKDDRERFLMPNFDRDMHDPFLFLHMRRVVERIGTARDSKESVGIFGDYDADGVTSSVIVREALNALGIEPAVYIPEKTSEGHGFSMTALDYFQKSGVTLILVLDCGMTNHDEIAEAKRRGIDTIILDHHHVPKVLPEAFAIINPKIENETYPFRELCGAGTSFKVAQALYQTFLPDRIDQLKWLLDVVAIGTVADVMPLIGENRVIVKYGLIVLGKTRRVGLQELLASGGIRLDENIKPDARMIGFQIAPRINATSRMAHAMLAHDLLMEKDREKAKKLAEEINALNTDRQKISSTTIDSVRKVVEEKYTEKKFIFAVDETYPFGIVGLVAGRIANEYKKPTCVLTKGSESSQGSFRSVPELNIIETIEECGHLLVKYGGHSQAAGMTILNERLEEFYELFNALVEKKLSEVEVRNDIAVDISLRPEHVTPKLLRDVSLFAPFGEKNPEPLFALQGMRVENIRIVGNGNKHVKLSLSASGNPKVFDAIGFSLAEKLTGVQVGDHLDVVFQLSENIWNGSVTLQLKLVDVQPSRLKS